MTPHIEAKKEDIAKIVIMPGDPLRAKYIAENFLTDYKLVNTIRGMYAYTGFYKNTKITVMAHGMGNPSMGIYSYELFKFYDVENIIRIGTVGAYIDALNLTDLVLVDKTYSETSFGKEQNNSSEKLISSNFKLNEIILDTAKNLDYKVNFGNIHCSDVFYSDLDYSSALQYNCLGVEMESYALFHNANVLNKKAACILSVSNSFVKPDELTSDERQTSLNKMILLSLESSVEISKKM